MHRTLTLVALGATGLFASTSTVSAQTTRTVCASGCQYTSINTAIDAAQNGDVIQLAAETYFEGEQIDTDGKAITLRGVLDKAGEPASVLDGAGAHRVLICQSGEGSGTVFDHLVIQNGLASGGFPDNAGGGMFNASSSPALTGCRFTSNTASDTGGGMFNYDSSSPTLNDCTFSNNMAGVGGGMFNDISSPTLTDCTFSNNMAGVGGGMINDSSSPTLNDCTFSNNMAGVGGGMINASSSPTLADCTFTDNSASDTGGGMYNGISSPTLTDCTFTDNTASDAGGGMYNAFSSSPTLINCTFTSNSPDSLVFVGGFTTRSPTCVPGDLDGDGDYDEDDARAAMADFGITEGTPGDMDGDDDVDAADFVAVRDQIGVDALGCLVADINGDGEVNGADFAYVLGFWGLCSAP